MLVSVGDTSKLSTWAEGDRAWGEGHFARLRGGRHGPRRTWSRGSGQSWRHRFGALIAETVIEALCSLDLPFAFLVAVLVKLKHALSDLQSHINRSPEWFILRQSLTRCSASLHRMNKALLTSVFILFVILKC